ncbi:CBO0543 family protein [Desulforamulus ruminis]|uniref:Uncharacterized protein n=1 Tax=Desulforamulus ruminis (strain ATCC 23193 / DSM 2154 / NCIMB 8452 / DL) TaxID=696281 RepID=F6DNI6_DESRL|nr:CBO0543 family protein [Desulforamulus ruminis]AEG58526.1 hypothetical protein Desru_0228 [Desulforamulus ruminis DSM 2154]
MNVSLENIIMLVSALVTLLLLLFAVNWRYFRDVVVVFLFKAVFDLTVGSMVEKANCIDYPVRLWPQYFDTPVLFEVWTFPVLCVLYNQITRERGFGPILYYAVLFSAGIAAIEYPIMIYTELIKYNHWTWFLNFWALFATFLASRAFMAFFRWGCNHFRPY